MTTTDFDRDDLLRQALTPGSGCPPLAELLDELSDEQVGGKPGPRAAALREHAAGCAACSAELALAGAFDATAKSPAEAQEIAWVVEQMQSPARPAAMSTPPPMARVLPMSEHTAKRARQARAGRGTEMSLWNRWAAAALIVVGLGVAFEWGHRTIGAPPAIPGAPGSVDSDVVRGSAIVLESPIGRQPRAVTEFAWRAIPGATSYRVEVRDVAGDLIWQGLAATSKLDVPPELATLLQTYVSYGWNVTALDALQSAVGHSQSARFAVEPAPH